MICPKCKKEMVHKTANIEYDHGKYCLSSIEQQYWYCENCDQDYDDEEFMINEYKIIEGFRKLINKYRR